MSEPPRPIAPGDVVTTFSEPLGEWVAGQVTHVDPETKMVAVVELDWSGPAPSAAADLGSVSPLRLTHHSWNNSLSHDWVRWVLPRSHRVVGSLPLLVTDRPNSFAFRWRLGFQLGHQRRWDDQLPEPDDAGRVLRVAGIDDLDCAALVAQHPDLVHLTLSGRPGTLSNAGALNGLTRLMTFEANNLFGMTAADHLLPGAVPALEFLSLHSIPAEYATATRKAWKPEIPNGTDLDISAPRKPEWIAENLTNPLRDWDGRPGISARHFKKAMTEYKATRKAVLAALAAGASVFELGESFGSAFNGLDFVETVEREELFAALDVIVDEAESLLSADLTEARESLASGVDAARDW